MNECIICSPIFIALFFTIVVLGQTINLTRIECTYFSQSNSDNSFNGFQNFANFPIKLNNLEALNNYNTFKRGQD